MSATRRCPILLENDIVVWNMAFAEHFRNNKPVYSCSWMYDWHFPGFDTAADTIMRCEVCFVCRALLCTHTCVHKIILGICRIWIIFCSQTKNDRDFIFSHFQMLTSSKSRSAINVGWSDRNWTWQRHLACKEYLIKITGSQGRCFAASNATIWSIVRLCSESYIQSKLFGFWLTLYT